MNDFVRGDSIVRRIWGDVDTVQSVFFRVDRPVELEVALRAKVPQGESRIRATVNGETFVKEL